MHWKKGLIIFFSTKKGHINNINEKHRRYVEFIELKSKIKSTNKTIQNVFGLASIIEEILRFALF